MTSHTLLDLAAGTPGTPDLWTPGYKIPWDDPDFSRRMLREHLSQDHDLASRRAHAIRDQADWITTELLGGSPASILDLGCGPGLYAPHLARAGHRYMGMDFGPASIEYARANHAVPGRCEFRLGNVLDTPFQGPFDLAMMLYGELNVFPPEDCAALLRKTHDALRPGGMLLLEVHTLEAVKNLGQGRSWCTAPSGLFSDEPYLCLTRGEWFDDEQTARQAFHIIDAATATVTTMRSTTKGWSTEEYEAILGKAGFANVRMRDTWPGGRDEFLIICAGK